MWDSGHSMCIPCFHLQTLCILCKATMCNCRSSRTNNYDSRYKMNIDNKGQPGQGAMELIAQLEVKVREKNNKIMELEEGVKELEKASKDQLASVFKVIAFCMVTSRQFWGGLVIGVVGSLVFEMGVKLLWK